MNVRRALILFLLVLFVPAGSAHADLDSAGSAPMNQERLFAGPTEIVLRFTEPIHESGSFIELYDQDGSVLAGRDQTTYRLEARPYMVLTLAEPLPDGAYSVKWQTLSQGDGHTIRGVMGFAVGNFVPPSSESTVDDTLTGLALSARLLQYAGLALILGYLAVHYLVAPMTGSSRHVVVGTWMYLAGVALWVADVAQQADLGYWASTALGDGLVRLRLFGAIGLALLTSLYFWNAPSSVRRILVGIGTLTLVAWSANYGHAQTWGQWGTFMQFLHATFAAAWIGGLYYLILSFAGNPGVASRFANLGLPSLLVILGSGIALSLASINLAPADIEASLVLRSAWVWLLIGKIVLFGAMIWHANRARRSQKAATIRTIVSKELFAGVLAFGFAAAMLSMGAPQLATSSPNYAVDVEASEGVFTVGLIIARQPVEDQPFSLKLEVTVDGEDGPNSLVPEDCEAPEYCVALETTLTGTNATGGGSAAIFAAYDGTNWVIENLLLTEPGRYEFAISPATKLHAAVDVVLYVDVEEQSS